MLQTTGNILMKRAELKDIYFNIYMTYTNSYTTLEDIGYKYDISKQRVWQIIRYCKLGGGNYYRGLEAYNKAHKEFKNTFKEEGSKVINKAIREWLDSNGVRLIKTKNEKRKD